MDPPTAFLVDDHLRRLARWMRSAGCDAAWEASIADRELYRRSWVEKRTILTMKKSLWAPRLLRVRSHEIREQFRQVVEECGLDPYERAFSRCVECNVVLDVVPREEVGEAVPPKAYAHYQVYRRCPVCAKVFWRGVHTERTLRFFEESTGRARPARFNPSDGN